MIYVHESSFAKHFPYFLVEVKPEEHGRLFHVVYPDFPERISCLLSWKLKHLTPSYLSPNLLFGEGRILFSKGNFGNKLGVLQDQKVFSREEQPQSGWSSPYSTLRAKAHEKSWYSAHYLHCSPRHQACVQTSL